jgi:YVTN family beta-propeller protein
MRVAIRLCGWFLPLVASYVATCAQADGPQFESPPVHPIEISTDGTRLFAVHQADHRLLIWDLTQGMPVRIAEIMVGLDPVTVRQRTETEVWVVNHLSDSVSIVDLVTKQIVRTLVVGNEPTDVAFAGVPERAFVCVSEEDALRVYDPANLDALPQYLPLDQSDPIALAVSPDQSTVYVAALDSGNRTTVVPYLDVIAGGGPPPPNPPMNPSLPDPPRTALIVKHDGSAWRDEIGRSWNAFLPYQLLDHDVIAFDAASLQQSAVYTDVGTNLFGIASSPVDGRLYVTNLESFNQIRFEPNVRGRFQQNRVTVIDPSTGVVSPRHINGHIDYDVPTGSAIERALSLSLPTAPIVSSDGQVYFAAFGSAKVGVLNADGSLARRLEVGDGPIGVALDEPRDRLYVLRRVPGALAVVDLISESVTTIPVGFDPTPSEIHAGRKRFYSGQLSSAHGDLSCASCHINGAMDNMAWDLGNPQGVHIPNPDSLYSGFHPMKGPLMTQALKSLTDTNPFHWRGDRPALRDFNPAFVSLMGREEPLTDLEFSEFEAFVFSLEYPPNPRRTLDGGMAGIGSGADPNHGAYLFEFGALVTGGGDCLGCHTPPTGQNNVIIAADLLEQEQDLKVPQIRNLYEKTRFDREGPFSVRGFGNAHDGATEDIVAFLQNPRFVFVGGDSDRADVAAFLLAFDSGTHAAVGAQWTMGVTNLEEGQTRVGTLMLLADEAFIGLVAKGNDPDGSPRGWRFWAGEFRPDRVGEPPYSLADLTARAADGRPVTFTAVYPGTEVRLGIDRDLDGFLDGDELDAGSDPGDPLSTPETVSTPEASIVTTKIQLDPLWPNPANTATRLAYRLPESTAFSITIHDVSGRLVRQLTARAVADAGRHERVWDLRNDVGVPVAAGLYYVRLSTEDGPVHSQRIVIQR